MASNFGALIAPQSGVSFEYKPTNEELQMKLKFNEKIAVQEKRHKLLQEVKENDTELDLEQDTYTMAFKALHFESMQQMELNPEDVHDAFQAAITVFLLQTVLIGSLALIITTGKDGFTIQLP